VAASWRAVFFEKSGHLPLDLIHALGTFTAFHGPAAARMKRVPERPKAVVSTGAWIVVSEAVEHSVPQRLEGRDQEAFPERNPDVVDDQELGSKMRYLEIGGRLALDRGYRLPVL
jgi:hypothetical protein